jgi:hypothetical protein
MAPPVRAETELLPRRLFVAEPIVSMRRLPSPVLTALGGDSAASSPDVSSETTAATAVVASCADCSGALLPQRRGYMSGIASDAVHRQTDRQTVLHTASRSIQRLRVGGW